MEEHRGGNHFEAEDAAFRTRLARACRFSDSDLAENRKGRLTASQKTNLASVAIFPFSKLLVSLAGFVAFAVLFQRVDPPSQISALMVAGAVGLSALFFGLVAFVIQFLLASGRVWNLLRDLSAGGVVSVTGRLTTSKSADFSELDAARAESPFRSARGPIVLRDYPMNEGVPERTETFCFVVKGEYFEIAQDAFDAMRDRDGRPYRVYVTPRSRYLVALESMSGSPTSLHW